MLMRITDQTTLGELAKILTMMSVRGVVLQVIPPEGTMKTIQWSCSIQHGPRGKQYDGGYAVQLEETLNEAASQLGLSIATSSQDK